MLARNCVVWRIKRENRFRGLGCRPLEEPPPQKKKEKKKKKKKKRKKRKKKEKKKPIKHFDAQFRAYGEKKPLEGS